MEKCDFTDWARAANADRMLKLHVRNKIRFTAVRVQGEFSVGVQRGMAADRMQQTIF